MDSRKPFIAGNWKMHKTPDEAARDAKALAGMVAGVTDVDIMIAPTFVCLTETAKALSGSNVALGGQDMHWEAEGAFTGAVSGPMLEASGCQYVIIGHSERRQFFGETDETVNRKIRAAREFGLLPVLCIGETKEERESGNTYKVLDRQVSQGLKDISFDSEADLVLAYEPVWAIGTGLTATPEQAEEAHAHIRGLLESLYSKTLANTVRILYGGSVKPGNARELMAQPDLDGALVGGASLDPETFSKIVRFQD